MIKRGDGQVEQQRLGEGQPIATKLPSAESSTVVPVRGTSIAIDTIASSDVIAMGAQAGTDNRKSHPQQYTGRGDQRHAMTRLKGRLAKRSNEFAVTQIPANSIGAVAIPGTSTSTTTTNSSTLTSIADSARSSSYTRENHMNIAPPTLVAELVPDDNELERRLQILEERSLQITVNAVSVEQVTGIDTTTIKILGLPKRTFWCFILPVVILMIAAVITIAVVVPGPETTGSSSETPQTTGSSSETPQTTGSSPETPETTGTISADTTGNSPETPETTGTSSPDTTGNSPEAPETTGTSSPETPSSSPETNSSAIDQLWMSVGDKINKKGGSWNRDPESTQYKALDWLAHEDQWRDSLEEGDIRTQVLVERYALVALLLSPYGESWPYNLDPTTSVCAWAGEIVCDGNHEFVTALNFTKSQIGGTLPSEVALLTSLVSLVLSRNDLSGTLPTELGQLTRLSTFDVLRNFFTGPIPTEFGRLTSLQTLNVSANGLTQTVPTEIGLLTNIEYIIMEDNDITGSIPTELGHCARLHGLHINRNQITGPLPTELGLLMSLQELNVRGNLLSGTIPTEIGLLANVTWLEISQSNLSGTFPTELGQCTALVRVGMQENQLSGNLSDILCGRGIVFAEFWSDCLTPNVTCSCCTDCCDGESTCTMNEMS